jgi:transcriptional regulator NrdR family protein
VKCPFCGDIGDKVVDSRESREGDVIRRRRQCLNESCRKRFTSYERIEEIPYMVVKKDGTRVMSELKKLDQVAYVRFASVYRDFRDVDDFAHEVRALKGHKE